MNRINRDVAALIIAMGTGMMLYGWTGQTFYRDGDRDVFALGGGVVMFVLVAITEKWWRREEM